MQTPRGFALISYWAEDLPAATRWYAELLGIEPYFEVPPGYVEFRFGEYSQELGLIRSDYRPAGAQPGPGGAVTYWHVDDVAGMLQRLLAMGATKHEDVTVRGEGFVTASVIDPFGNIFGVMYNQHFLDVLAARQAG